MVGFYHASIQLSPGFKVAVDVHGSTRRVQGRSIYSLHTQMMLVHEKQDYQTLACFQTLEGAPRIQNSHWSTLTVRMQGK